MQATRQRPRRTRWGGLLLLTALLAAGSSCGSRTDPDRFLKSGKQYLEAKEYARAILQLKNAARARPKDAEVYYQLGLAYLGAGDFRAATEHWRKAGTLDARHAGAQLKLAELLAASGSIEGVREAEKHAQAALTSAPDNADALATLAWAEFRLGKEEDAAQRLRQALEKFPQHLRSATTLATMKLARKDFTGAGEVLRKAAAEAPQSVEAAVALERFYVLTGNLAAAKKEIQRGLALDSRNPAALLDLAAVQMRGGERDEAERTFRTLSELPDKQYKPLHAIFLLQQGQDEAAVAEFEKLARQDHQDRDARTRLVGAYMKARRTADAQKLLNEALQKNSKDFPALLQRGEIYLSAGKIAEAQRDVTEALGLRPDVAEAHYWMARVHLARGERLNQRQELTEAIRLNPKLLAARLELAQSLIAGRSAKAALELINQAPEEHKQSLPLIVQRNWAMLAAGDQGALRQGIEQGLARAKTPDLLLQDALAKLQQQNYSGARVSLEAALSQNPEDLRALDVLARSYVMQKQPAVALQKVREHAARSPASAPLQGFLGRWTEILGSVRDARAAYAAAKSADPGYTNADLSLARLDLIDGKLDSARQTLSAVLASQPELHAARVLLGMVEEGAGRPAEAIAHYRQVVAADRSNFVALNNLAYRLAVDGGQLDEAIRFAQQAKELAPNHPSVEDTIGWAFYRKGIYRTAVAHLESASAKSSDAVIKYHLGMAYLKAGDATRGRQTLVAALRLNPTLPEAKAARELLAEAGPSAP